MSKIYSRVSRWAIALFMGLTASACAVVPQAPSSSAPPPSADAAREREQALPLPDDGPRALASLRFTEQARLLLESGRVDDAIAMLERALNLNPSNGQNYYYLAEAWIKKGNHVQAREFNRLGAMYLRDEPEWISRVNDQKERIGPR